MKHPALARVFAVVVAILGLLLLLSGTRGFGKAEAADEERRAYEKKYAERIETYSVLREELLNSADYQETMDALNRFLTEHEKAASQHKTDTAIFSATRGGLRMGEDMIVMLRAQMNEIREQLRDTNSRKAFLEGLLTELIASQKSRMPWLDALAAQAAQYAAESYTQGAKVALVSAELRALMENEPTPASVSAAPFNPPEEPVAMVLPGFADMGGLSMFDMQAAYQAAADAFMASANAYQQSMMDYAGQMQAYYDASGQALMDRLNGARPGVADAVSDAALSAEYKLAHALWEDECRVVKGQLDLHEARSAVPRLSAALTALVRQGDSVSVSVTAETGGLYPALGELNALADSTGARIDMRLNTDLAHLSNEDFLDLTDDVEEFFDMVTDAFIVVAQNLDNPAALITELLDRLHITEALSKLLDEMLEKADQQMQAQLEELWYQMGEAEKDVVKLEAEKLGLDKEAVLLTKRTLDADALKDLRSRHAAVRQQLINVPEIREAAPDDAQLADCARAWLQDYARETIRLRRGRLAVNLLAVTGGAMGVLGIPAAYELLRRRFLLIAPVLLCLACAAGAEALNLKLGLGQHYVALSTAIFAFLQLLIVLPKAKKPRYAPRH